MEEQQRFEEFASKITTQKVVSCTRGDGYVMVITFEDGSVYEITMNIYEMIIVNRIDHNTEE